MGCLDIYIHLRLKDMFLTICEVQTCFRAALYIIYYGYASVNIFNVVLNCFIILFIFSLRRETVANRNHLRVGPPFLLLQPYLRSFSCIYRKQYSKRLLMVTIFLFEAQNTRYS